MYTDMAVHRTGVINIQRSINRTSQLARVFELLVCHLQCFSTTLGYVTVESGLANRC